MENLAYEIARFAYGTFVFLEVVLLIASLGLLIFTRDINYSAKLWWLLIILTLPILGGLSFLIRILKTHFTR